MIGNPVRVWAAALMGLGILCVLAYVDGVVSNEDPSMGTLVLGGVLFAVGRWAWRPT